MMVFAVIDTNVLVSAMLSKHPDSVTSLLLEHLFAGNVIPMYDDEILAEYNEVLRRPRFPFSEEDVAGLIDAIVCCGVSCGRISAVETVSDPKDVVFYEVAMSREDSFLVTGNVRHFPSVARVVTPNEMLDIIDAALKK